MKKKNDKSKGLFVKVENNNIEKALREFKQKVKDSELFLEIKEKSFYTKPSEKRRKQKSLARIRSKALIEKEYKQLY
jgi:small subunit ribosomal protein S21